MGEKQKPAADSQLVVKKQLSYAEIEQVGKAFVASGMFGGDMDRTSKAITKIMAGRELGLAPFASMRAVHVIEGNATLSANTMAGMVKSSGRYDYTIVKKELDGCTIDFYEYQKGKRVKIGTETFDIDEARMAGMLDPECTEAPLKHNIRPIKRWNKWKKQNEEKDGCLCKDNWKNYPKAMMFARAISNGVRTYCPDVFSGMLVYTPDELNAQVRADGTVIDIDPSTGEVTNVTEPEQKNDSKKSDKEEAEVSTPEDEQLEAEAEAYAEDPSNEGTEDHPDVTDPNEPEIPEDEGSGDSAEVEPEEVPEPLPPVDDDFKEAAWGMYESLPLKAQFKLRWLKEVTGVITQKSIKTEQQWRDLMARAEAVIAGDEEIPAEQRTDAGEQGKIV